MTHFFSSYPKDKFLSMLTDAYYERAGLVPGTSTAANRLCERFTDWFYGKRIHNSLLIYGGVGTGKTTLVEALTNTIRKLYDMNMSSNLHTRVKAWQVTNEELLKDGLIDMLAEAKGLVIDDLGSEAPVVKIYGSEWRPMEMLVKRRSDDQKPTIITTNLSLEGIERQYNSRRMADVLAEYDKLIIDNTKSFRR